MAPKSVKVTITARDSSNGRRSFTRPSMTTSEAANAMTITPQPLAPIHWAEPRGHDSVPIG